MPNNQALKPVHTPPKLGYRMDIKNYLQDYMTETFGCRRPPIVAAAVLAFIIELDRTNTPFPPRQEVADTIGCSKYTVDSAISQAIARGLLVQDVEISEGHVSRRESIVRTRYYRPTKKLYSALAKSKAA